MKLSGRFRELSLSARVFLSLAASCLIALAGIAWLSIEAARSQINQSASAEAGLIAQNLSHVITEPAILGDLPAIEQHLARRASQPGIAWMKYTDHTGYQFIKAGAPAHEHHLEWFGRWFDTGVHAASHPVAAGGRTYGQVSVQVDTKSAEDRAWKLAGMISAALLAMLAFCAWVIHRILHANLKGLMAMREMARKLQEGNFEARVQIGVHSPPEVRETADILNYSVQRVRELMIEMRRMAFHDPLTGLPNRRAIEDRLGRAFRLAREENSHHVFCYIDLDQFKIINDTCGHAAGDQLLAQLPQVLKPLLPANAYLGRLGGDEFGLILFDTDIPQAQPVARRIIDAIHDHDFTFEGASYQIGATIGITLINRDTQVESEILAQADMACYTAKQAGRNRSHVYELAQSGVQKLREEMQWINWFNKSIDEDRLELFRQRVAPLDGRDEAPHYEVLLRIRRYRDVLEPPGPFLIAAEKHGLSPEVDRFVIHKLCRWLSEYPDDPASYSVNLSALSLNDEHFLDFILEMLDIHEIDGRRISFEITETAAIQNLDNARRLIAGLKSRGCAFYLDDFGKGMASFSYLKHLPADYLKIDGSFVLEMLRDPADFAIVNAFNQIAHDLSRKSVAECVENQYQMEKLREIGVDYVQGYAVHLPEPLPVMMTTARRLAG